MEQIATTQIFNTEEWTIEFIELKHAVLQKNTLQSVRCYEMISCDLTGVHFDEKHGKSQMHFK